MPLHETRILIVDDHAVVRRGLGNLFMAHIPHARVTEERTCLGLQRQLTLSDFELVLLDLVLPDGNTIDLLPGVIARHLGLRVLMYSMSAEEVYAERARMAGAMGFITKAEDEEELLRAVRMVLKGKPYLSPMQEARVLGRSSAELDPFRTLSSREISTMEHLLRGRTIGEVAALMGVGHGTATTFKARLFNKLGVHNVLELQRKADAHGYCIS
jgi:two-component system invasion response regulator UvrY